MRPERILRSALPLLIGLAIGVSAYLQAVGLQHLVEVTLRDRVPPARLAGAGPAMIPTGDAVADATPILARNPFDSVTGALAARSGDGGGFDHFALPEARLCEDVHAVLIAASSEGWSFAMLAGPDGKRQLRREGDVFREQAVTAIGWDRVWLARAGARCEARLGAPPLPVSRGAPQTADHDSSGFRRTGPGQYQIERRLLDGFLENPQGAFGRVRVAAEAGGVRVSGIRAGSWAARLGLEDGDRIEGINGMPLATPEDALSAYARLRNAERLQLVIVRAGQHRRLDYAVR